MISSRDTAASNKQTPFGTYHILPTLSSTNQVEIRNAPRPSFAQDEQESAHRTEDMALFQCGASVQDVLNNFVQQPQPSFV